LTQSTYVVGDEINAAAKAKSVGAKVIVEVREVMSHGHMSVLSDPTGATIALWQRKKHSAQPTVQRLR
jgi:predicted enzyme related to lactoylglutathione lyase